jgi:GGDEF domain-containing protein
MADELGFTEDFLAKLNSLDNLSDKTSRQAYEKEIATIDMYQVAANSKEERDPRYVGEIENLLRTNDTSGLKARLGEKRATEVQEAYNAAWRKVEHDRNLPRSPGQVVADSAIGIGGAVINGVLNAEAAIVGSPVGEFFMDIGGIGEGSPMNIKDQYVADTVQRNRDVQEDLIDPTLSQTVHNQRKLVGLEDAKDEKDHSLAAIEEGEAARGEFLPTLGAWTGRVGADALSGAENTLSNPTMAAQGTADAMGSMILAGGVSKGLGLVGEQVIAAKTNQILTQQLAAGVERTVAQKLAAEGVAALREKVGRATAATSVGVTEGSGAYQQQAERVLSTSFDELYKNSPDFKTEVAELNLQGIPYGEAQEIVRNRIANKSAQVAAAGTGLVSAGIGHFLPEGTQKTFSPVRSLTQDTIREGVEETLQGATGQLIGNAANQAYANQNQDILSGVGTQAGAGGVLGILSSGVLKGPGGAIDTVRSGVRGVATNIQERASQKESEIEASSPSSVQGLVQRTNDLTNDSNNLTALAEAAESAATHDSAANEQLAARLNDFNNSLVVSLPGSASSLTDEQKASFKEDMHRAEAVDTAARMLLAEKDPKKAQSLAQFYADLMAPVQANANAQGLESIKNNAKAGKVIEQYQSVLNDIAALPSVQKANQRLAEVLANGPKTPESLAALAIVDSNMGGKVTSAEVQNVLTHATPGTFTDAQQTALKGSLALLKAREAQESLRDPEASESLLARHLGGDRNAESTSRQATVEINPISLNNDKYSARGHVDSIINAMMGGRIEEAQAYMSEFGNFVQHFQNKVTALNESSNRDGENISYQQYIGNGKFADSATNPKNYTYKTLFVNEKSENSLKQAKSINAEANLLSNLYDGLRQAYPELNSQEIAKQSLTLAPKVEPKKNSTRFSEQVAQMGLRQRATLIGTDYVTGLRTRSSWEESKRTGEKVMILTSTAVKPINDDPNGGHDVTNNMLRAMGTAVAKIDPNAARGGTNFILETNRSPEEVMAEVSKVLPEGVELTYGMGNDLEAAYQDESARTEGLRKEGKLPERGQTAFDLTKLPDTKFSEDKAPERLSQQTVDRVRTISDEQFESQVLMDPVTPGVLSGVGWRLIPRKAFVASIDLKGLKKLNDLISKEFGNDYLRVFSEVGLEMGGAALDFAHLSGDEYAVQADSEQEVWNFLNKLEQHLNDNVRLNATNEKTGVTMNVIPAFRRDVGTSYGEADRKLNAAKRAELAAAAQQQQQVQQQPAANDNSGGVREGTREEPGTVEADGSNSEGQAGVEQQVTPVTTAERFPRLFAIPGKVRNFFAQGLKNRPDSVRTAGEANPLVAIRNAIKDQIAIRQFIGKDPRGTLNPEVLSAWKSFVGETANQVGSEFNRNLRAFLTTPYTEGGKTMEQMLKDGDKEVTLMQRGKPTNLLEQTEKGTFQYNQSLLQSAVMAALQWHLSSEQRSPVQRPDEIAQELGLQSAEDVPRDIIDAMSKGQNLAQAKQSMASYIRRFWGVGPDPKMPMGYGEAIIESMAAEALRALEAAKLVEVQKTTVFYDKDGQLVYPYKGKDWKKDGLTPFDIYRYTIVPQNTALNNYPELLEEMIVINPEFASYYGKDGVPPVADRQLSNSQVQLSKQAKTALKNMQEQQFFLNMPMVEGILKLGEEGVITLFGNPMPKDAESNYNKAHLESLESQNKSLRGAFKELTRLVGEMRNQAGDGDVAKLGKRYQYAVNSVNRIMMLGQHNPQANKLMREMILPTWATLNMADQSGAHYQYFMQAFAQAMQQKVHQNTLAENVKWSQEAITGKLSPVIDVLSSWLQTKDAFPTAEYQKALEGTGIENGPLVAMALIEVARLQTADLTAFRTPLYLESDGMTNGPFNSMGLLATSEVVAQDIQNWRRGGLSVGADPKTADQLRKTVGKTDLYKEGMVSAQTYVNDQLRAIQKQKNGAQVLSVANGMFAAMKFLLGNEVSWDKDKQEWQFERGLGKNPSTVLVYGAGNPGIANKLVSRITDSFYEKLSAMAKVGGTWEDAALEMFPDQKPADALYNAQTLRKAIDALAASKVVKAKDGGFVVVEQSDDRVSTRVDDSPQKFEFSKEDLGRMQTNMLFLMVNPMKEGIRDVLGPSVFASGDLLVAATNLQSTVAREVYLKAVKNALDAKIEVLSKEYNGDTKRARQEIASTFLSREELNKIWNDLKDVMPLVDVDGQRFLIAKNALLSAGGKHANEYSRALDDSMRTEPYVEGIAPAGVNARPYLTIGMGDARMVRKVFENPIDGVMQVFDGINLRIDKIQEYGARINQAAAEAWTGNIFEGVSTSFSTFANHPKVMELLKDEATVQRLLNEGKVNVADIGTIRNSLAAYTVAQQARNKALAKFATSWDQMSGTYSPHVTKGENLTGTDEQIAAAINDEIRKQSKVEETNQLKSGGTLHKTGVYVYNQSNMAAYLSWLARKVTPEEASILRDIMKSGNLKNTKIVLGNSAQVQEFQKAEGLSSSLAPLMSKGQQINGYFHPDENTIYLMNGSVETAVHEIIHAGTIGTVMAYYEGKTVKSAEQIRALERLMGLFLSEEVEYQGLAGQALSDARRAILAHQGATPANRANMLNEFMAWTLANRALVTEQSKVDNTLSKLARIAKSAFDALIKLVTGRDNHVVTDSFSNQIRFNTALVARESTVQDMVSQTSLAHATVAGVESNRLTDIAEAFGDKIARYLTSNPADMNKTMADPLALAKETTTRAQSVFPMNQQAQDTFYMMVMAMATEAKVNPQAMIEAQKIYQHFLKGLNQSDFRTNQGDENADIEQARQKFDFISGHTQSAENDPSGRSTLLPVFMALATVNDEFRALLGQKQLPEKIASQVVGMDSALEVAGNRLLDKLQERLAGQNHPENVRVAIDQLTQSIIKTNQDSLLSMADKIAPTGIIQDWNTKVSDMLDRAGAKAGRTSDKLAESKNPIARGAATVLGVVSILSSEENAAVVAEEMLLQMDKHPSIGTFFKDVVADMIGRTKSQANIYDMIKRVRALVSQTRQAYRENVPAIISKKFKNEPTTEQWNSMYRTMGRFDMASLLNGRSVTDTLALASDKTALTDEIDRMEALFGQTKQGQKYLDKINQYVNFVLTGERGVNLLRNANAISELLNEKPDGYNAPTAFIVQEIDQLMTLKMLETMTDGERTNFSQLVTDEVEGMEFILNYLNGQRKTEMSKANEGMAKYNHYKGLLPYELKGRGHVVVVDDTKHTHMVQMGYERMGEYKGSSIENKGASKSYWYSPEGGVKTTYNQGIAQNVQGTAYGVRTEDGSSLDSTAGTITDPVYVKILTKRLSNEAPGLENLSPVFDHLGNIKAFERSLNPEQTKVLQGEQHLGKMIGEWKGRQVEENWSGKINKELLGHLRDMYAEDNNKDRYVNLLGEDLDPVLKDAVSIMPRELKAEAERLFGNGNFFVRKNLLNSVVGYRNASIGDLWTGISRWSPELRTNLRTALMAMPGMGDDAYRKLVWAERNWQAAMATIRTNIVVRSMIVPAANFMSGVLQLNVRGIPMLKILRTVPKKVAELEFYSKTMAQKIQLEAEKFANENNVNMIRKLDAQITTLDDSMKRLTIWPLIEAGEFSTISDVGQTAESLGTGDDTLIEKLSKAVDELPPGLRDLARQGYMARDTALFQALQKSVQYSDFVMKAIYFDSLTDDGQSTKAALASITEEFNNYDVPPGRNRGYAESIGLAWFLNYKIRATKIGLSMIRKNPLHMLLYMAIPHPSSSGIPVTDNLITSLMELSLGRSFGPGMATSPIALNPWYNLAGN